MGKIPPRLKAWVGFMNTSMNTSPTGLGARGSASTWGHPLLGSLEAPAITSPCFLSPHKCGFWLANLPVFLGKHMLLLFRKLIPPKVVKGFLHPASRAE